MAAKFGSAKGDGPFVSVPMFPHLWSALSRGIEPGDGSWRDSL